MKRRDAVPKAMETQVLTASRRRCCVCVYMLGRDEVRRGQVAHLNRKHSDARFLNLVWLCLEHHDEYDTRTSQSKGLTTGEVREYRDRLYKSHGYSPPVGIAAEQTMAIKPTFASLPHVSDYAILREANQRYVWARDERWRFPLWLVANRLDLFAYKARNRCDGVCLIERIDLPDGRIVIACIEPAGNPGQSITNSIETICFQVCERFDIPARRVVWLEHYDYMEGWMLVQFEKTPPDHLFENPTWDVVTPEMWQDMGLQPKKTIPKRNGELGSKLRKTFPWPSDALLGD